MLCSTYLGTSVCPSNVFAHDNSFCGGITALYATVKTTDLDFGISVIYSCKILDMWQSNEWMNYYTNHDFKPYLRSCLNCGMCSTVVGTIYMNVYLYGYIGEEELIQLVTKVFAASLSPYCCCPPSFLCLFWSGKNLKNSYID